MPNRIDALREIARVLTPGGRLYTHPDRIGRTRRCNENLMIDATHRARGNNVVLVMSPDPKQIALPAACQCDGQNVRARRLRTLQRFSQNQDWLSLDIPGAIALKG